jgi:hypothetical protein
MNLVYDSVAAIRKSLDESGALCDLYAAVIEIHLSPSVFKIDGD